MARKPSNLTYGLDEKPSPGVTLFLGFQHAAIFAISFVIPIIVVRESGGSTADAARLISMSMFAGGIGSILQALRRGPVGSGYVCPQVCGPSFLTASIMAVKSGGLPLMFGMTFLAGVFETTISRVVRRLRVLFPTEVTGLIVMMVGVSVVPVASRNFLGLTDGCRTLQPKTVLVAALTLAVIIGLNIWGKGKFKLFCVIIGMAVGYVASYFAGILTVADFSEATSAPFLSFPLVGHPGWAFDIHLVIPFIVAMLCSTLKTVGDLTTCQKINDADWKRPDMKNIGNGVLADGMGCASAGLFGGFGQSSSSSNIALTIATAATSRVIAYYAGGLLIVLAFLPRFSSIFAIMPQPVMGASLIFVLGFMVVAGMQIISSRMLDGRKTLVVGISVILGLSVDAAPEAYHSIHSWVQPIFSSSLSTATIAAIILNLVFRIGISKKVRLEFKPGVDSSEKIFAFMERQGGAWGARKEVVFNAVAAMNEFVEAAAIFNLTRDAIVFNISFDEFNLDVRIRYKGKPVEFPVERPSKKDLRTEGEAMGGLALFLVRQYADKTTVERDAGTCEVLLHFEH